MDEPYHIGFVTDQSPGARDLYNRCIQGGMETTPDGQSGVVAKYRIGLTAHTDSSLESALTELEEAENGSLYFWTDSGMKLRVGITEPTSEAEEWIGRVSISFQTSEIDRGSHADSTYQARIDDLLDLVAEVVSVADPQYVWSSVYKGHESFERFVPDDHPIADHVDNLSWITVMSEQVAKQFGGLDHVLETPAWQVRELDSRHIMLVLSADPHDAMEPAYSPSEEHLFRH